MGASDLPFIALLCFALLYLAFAYFARGVQLSPR
jgi:hypothetical protein